MKIAPIYLLALCAFFLSATRTHAQVLNFYYGNIHAHTSYSDGNQDAATSGLDTPYQDYRYAKASQHFDFLGISEHNHYQAGMHRADYAKGLRQADNANQDGIFVAMYGMEWGVIGPPGGHVLIYGVNQLIGWDTLSGQPNYDLYTPKGDYAGLFARVARTPGAFACLAHPQTTDYSNLFSSTVDLTADSAITGVAIRSGPATSSDTTYTDPSTSTYEVRFKDALKRGYHVGANLDHDNHNTTFGRMAKSRTVVLAPSLTRANIMSAFRNMRTQASDDWNVKVTYMINGRPLGSIITDTSNAYISVSVTDPDLESTSSISIQYGIPGSGSAPTTLTSTSNSSTLSYVHNMALGGNYYYYAVITQADGDKVFTSPIWFNKLSTMPVKLLYFDAKAEGHDVRCSWATASEINASQFVLERSSDALRFESIATLPAAGNSSIKTLYDHLDKHAPAAATLYYRLKQVDADGSFSYSNIVSVEMTDIAGTLQVSPNPFKDELTITCGLADGTGLLAELFNGDGRKVYEKKVQIRNEEALLSNLPHLDAGIYHLRLSGAGLLVSKRVLKAQ